MAPALWVMSKNPPLVVACMDAGQGREQDAEALLVAYLESPQKRQERFCAPAPKG